MSFDWSTLPFMPEGFAGFAWRWMWLAFPLPWLAGWILPARRSQSDALKVPYAPQALLEISAVSSHRVRRRGVVLLSWLGWALLCTAAARPQSLGEPVTPPNSGRNLMLAVDLSGSMSEADMQLGNLVVDRLTAAKAVLADFLERRNGDRVGLLVFGQRAYALTPLTRDLASVRDQLKDSVVGLAGRETALGDAIGLAVKRLRDQPRGQRVLILLTDGVNTAGTLDPLKAAELAKAEGVRVHTIAFGGDAGVSIFGIRMPLPDGGRDEMDEASMRKIAEMTGGKFFRARDIDQLVQIYAELDRIEPVEQAGAAIRPRLERYPIPLMWAGVVGLLAFAWPRRAR